ncbi:nicotinate-nucleotide adenylyltransferase [Actibacterium sp.]|uniref:nicotinate-nucleotide adenylyltransferase n=1 Tax=Actibacterium sp. TaxID=1872125 RepID=UPI0035652EE4
MRDTLPYARPGQTIGLLGGSFDPAHEGHAHITREALKRFGLDRVWWLVSPGNPLKPKGPAPIARRIQAARAIIDHPRVCITDIEAQIGTRYTAQTLTRLQQLYPGVRFVWLMGADNLAGFHRWENWQWIMENVPIGVLARPGQRLQARMSKAAESYARYRVSSDQARLLGQMSAPAWCFVNVPMLSVSSSEIRARGEWKHD